MGSGRHTARRFILSRSANQAYRVMATAVIALGMAAAAGTALTGRAADLTAATVPAVLALDFGLLADACGPLAGLRGTALSFWSGREGPFVAPTTLRAPFLLAAAAELAVRPAVCAFFF